MNSGIYTITCLSNNKIYVGSSTRLEKRLLEHFHNLRNGCHKNVLLQNAFNKYGSNQFKFEILEECDVNYLNSFENYWCNLLDSYNLTKGYNVRPIHPDGYHAVSDRSKIKMSLARVGFKPTPQQISKRVEIVKKPVLQVDLNDNIVAEFASAFDAQQVVGIDASAIGKCCKNKPNFNTAGGFKWRYQKK